MASMNNDRVREITREEIADAFEKLAKDGVKGSGPVKGLRRVARQRRKDQQLAAMTKERDALKTEVLALQQQDKWMAIAQERTQAACDLEIERDALKAAMEKMTATYDKLAASHRALKSERDMLREVVKEAGGSYQALKAENERLREANAEWQGAACDQGKVIEKLETEVKKLKLDLEMQVEENGRILDEFNKLVARHNIVLCPKCGHEIEPSGECSCTREAEEQTP